MLDKPQPTQDRDIVSAFVKALTGSAETVMRLRFVHWTKPKEFPSREREGPLDWLWPHVLELQAQGYCTYYFLNETNPGPGSGYEGMAEDADVTEVCRALATDHDTGLPEEWDWHFTPRIVVHTSRVARDGTVVQKGQAIWPVSNLTKEVFKTSQRRLAAHYRGDTSVCNPSRLLRLPGTLHLKDPGRPQLVTFERYDGYPRACSAGDVLAGLSEASPDKKATASAATGVPVPIDHLRKILGYLNPDAPRNEWRDVIAAVRATPMEGDLEESRRRQLALEFSRGELDRQKRWEGKKRPSRYTGDDAVNKVFDTMPPIEGGVTYGTLHKLAKDAGYLSAQETFAAYIANSTSDAVSEHATGAQSSAAFLLTEGEVFAWPDPAELVAGFLMQGENACIFGEPKVGKTFLALDIAYSIAANLPVFGHLAVRKSGSVVYLSGEGHAGMKRRLRAWRQARGIAADRKLPFFYKAAVPVTAKGMDECQAYIEGIRGQLGRGPVLVVIDTMARSMIGLNENDAGDVGLYLALTEGLRAALDCTVLTLAHSGKDPTKGVRGSNASQAGFDAVWLTEMNEANKTVKLEYKWLKDAEGLGPFCFRLKHVSVANMKQGKSAVVESVPLAEFKAGTTDDQRKLQLRRVHDVLDRHGIRGQDNGLETRALAEIMTGRNPPPESARKARQEWATAVAQNEEHLQNGSRSKGDKVGRRPLYEGYYEKVTRPGGTRLVKLWFLPAEDDQV